MRKLTLALACSTLLGAAGAQAMGLGEPVVRSHLNQPLQAEIPILDVSPEELESLRARLADAQTFERLGYSLGALSGGIQVRIENGRRPRILLTSKNPIQDPLLGVVLELQGLDGVIQRGFDILLDPPGFAAYQVATPSFTRDVIKTEGSRYTGSSLALQGRLEDGYYWVGPGDTLWRIAQKLRPPGVSTEQMMAAMYAANPHAFASPGRLDSLFTGTRLAIPSPGEIRRAKPVQPPAPSAPKAPARAEPQAPAPVEPKLAIVPPAEAQPPEEAKPPAEPLPVEDEGLVRMQEQLAAVEVEKEQLLGRLEVLEAQVAKMQELLRLKDEQIAQLEQATAKMAEPEQPAQAEPSTPAVAERSAAAQSPRPPAPVPQPPAPVTQGGLFSFLIHPFTLAGGLVILLLLALLIARLRRQGGAILPKASPAASPEPAQPSTATTPAAGPAAPSTPPDPVQAVLEEVDILQAYGLHERALKILDDALAHMPKADVLAARRIRLLLELGARDAFLRAAEAYRASHPADDPHWAAIEALGKAAFPDSPLFGGEGSTQPTPKPSPVGPAAAGPAKSSPPAFEMPRIEEGPSLEPVELKPVVLPEPGVVSPASQSPRPDGQAKPAASPAPLSLELEAREERPAREAISLEPLTLEWPAKAEEPKPAEEVPLELEPSAPPAAEAPEKAERGGFRAEDLALLGLEEGLEPLELPVQAQKGPEPKVPVEGSAPRQPDEGQAATNLEVPQAASPALAIEERPLKLDMAEAMLELGDMEGARELLEEIIAGGEDELGQRARALLEQCRPGASLH